MWKIFKMHTSFGSQISFSPSQHVISCSKEWRGELRRSAILRTTIYGSYIRRVNSH